MINIQYLRLHIIKKSLYWFISISIHLIGTRGRSHWTSSISSNKHLIASFGWSKPFTLYFRHANLTCPIINQKHSPTLKVCVKSALCFQTGIVSEVGVCARGTTDTWILYNHVHYRISSDQSVIMYPQLNVSLTKSWYSSFLSTDLSTNITSGHVDGQV